MEAFAIGALRRGAEIEQFLGPKEHNGERGVAWVEIWPREEGYVLTLFGGVDRADGYQGQRNLYALPSFLFPHEDDEDMPFCQLGVASEPLGALRDGGVADRGSPEQMDEPRPRHGRVRRLRASGKSERVACRLGSATHALVPPAKAPAPIESI